MASSFGLFGFIVVPETSAPVLLQRRAKKVHYETRNWAIHPQMDERQVDLKGIAERYLARPIVMLIKEPILVLITLYMGLIYGILFLFFEAFPITFQEERGWNLGVGALPLISILVGVILGGLVIDFFTQTRMKQRLEREGVLVPEERLIPMIIGGGLLPAGLFWFAWTSNPNITPWPQIISCVPIGMGVLMIFLQGLNCIIDVYKFNANSGHSCKLAVPECPRSWLPDVRHGDNLGVPWATSLLAFLTVALFPVPIVFYVYGAKIRKLSKFTPDL